MTQQSRIKTDRLTEHLGYWMRVVSNHVSHAFAHKLAACKVTVAEWVILRQMYSQNDTIAPSTIAELTGLTRGAISKLIERLIQKGLVLRAKDKADQRYQELKLTTKAIELIPQLVHLADQNDQHFFKSLSADEKLNLTQIL